MVKKRGTFGSRFGVIVAVGGSVVGLGNIWRFPYIAGENGGAAFILIYICISLLIAVPVMLSEFVIGRSSKRNALRAFKKLAPGTWWPAIGMLGIVGAFVIVSFYS
ncbi:MAG: sodium-dependent transporter, partial [Rikenellaceae bacterium]|nr:sodium-dependent transporter [Rikenellaceae bacterium]